MPLYDITNKPSLVSPADAEGYEVIQAVKARTATNTWERIVKTVDEAIGGVEPSEKSKLIWTRSAALFGHNSLQPKKHVDHIWDNVIAAVGDDKNCLKAVGGLLRWRISLRPETWLAFRQDTDEIDPETGKKITASTYWINESFEPPARKTKSLPIDKLAEKWGATVR